MKNEAKVCICMSETYSHDSPKTKILCNTVSLFLLQVLVIYTGGTIGMTRNEEGALSPKAHAMESVIRQTITMHDEQYSRMREY